MILPPAIFGIGRNYVDHVHEMHGDQTENIVVFMKNPAAMIANGQPICIPNCCRDEDQVDYEGELGIQILSDCRNVSEEEAIDYVGGYAVANDVTARSWQKTGSGGQWVRGKSFDTFCPITSFVHAAKVTSPQDLTIETRLNGELMQLANTSEMIFNIPKLVSAISQDMTILAGTIILTGTPSGVGVARSPQRFLHAGDVIEVIIEGVGHLSNRVEHAKMNC